MKIFFIAGSNNQAMAPVEPATTRDKISESINILKCFFTYELKSLNKGFFYF